MVADFFIGEAGDAEIPLRVDHAVVAGLPLEGEHNHACSGPIREYFTFSEEIGAPLNGDETVFVPFACIGDRFIGQSVEQGCHKCGLLGQKIEINTVNRVIGRAPSGANIVDRRQSESGESGQSHGLTAQFRGVGQVTLPCAFSRTQGVAEKFCDIAVCCFKSFDGLFHDRVQRAEKCSAVD